MSNPPSRRNRNGLLLPLALTVSAAAASFALWYFLSDGESENSSRRHQDGRDNRRQHSPTDCPSPPSADDHEVGPPRHKKSVAIVVKEGSTSSQLLHQLPSPLPLDAAVVFILVYSADISAHPLTDSDEAAFEKKDTQGKVYRQARRLFPKDAPPEYVMPYTDEASLLPMLKQLSPESVYIETKLVGEDAENVKGLVEGGWVSGVVISAEDSETACQLQGATERFGQRCRVLHTAMVGEDWKERVWPG
jgi:hypothetical protein